MNGIKLEYDSSFLESTKFNNQTNMIQVITALYFIYLTIRLWAYDFCEVIVDRDKAQFNCQLIEIVCK